MTNMQIQWLLTDSNKSYREPHLTIRLSDFLDDMPIEQRKEFVSCAIADGELLKQICLQIASENDVDKIEKPAYDIILSDQVISDMRQALMPLLSKAYAEEMRKANAKAREYENEANAYYRLSYVFSMYQKDPEGRKNQWEDCLHELRVRFPEHFKE